jgi:hypothetical protein
MEQKIIDRKDLPRDFWNHSINPITGFHVGRYIQPFRPMEEQVIIK